MYGYLIEERPCPRCAIQRTVRMSSWGNVCFNCRLRWHPGESNADLVAVGFKPAGLRRLEIYRAAVQAGFYTDWPRG